MASIRFIDPDFRRSNPSTNGLVDVALRLVSAGWHVEVFSHEIEPELIGKVKHRPVPAIVLPLKQSHWGYFLYYNFQALKDRLNRRKNPGVTVCTGFLFLPADISTVHFSHFDFVTNALRHGRSQPYFVSSLALGLSGLLTELVFLWNPWRTKLLPVSNSVAADMKRFGAPWKRVSVLPNTVSTDKFSPASRLSNRKAARTEHGFSEDEIILLFSSMGQHFRKGFFLATEAIAELRRRGHPVKMLLVGGHPSVLSRISRALDKKYPDQREWIAMSGPVDDTEFHYSAADALIFPSLSEAFSLVEIEASALGLPLYLTPHHGSEMILEEGVNGRLLPWDIRGMADVLEQEILNGLPPTDGVLGAALSQEEYYRKFRTHITECCPDKQTTTPI